jgi:hypothetical protein
MRVVVSWIPVLPKDLSLLWFSKRDWGVSLVTFPEIYAFPVDDLLVVYFSANKIFLLLTFQAGLPFNLIGFHTKKTELDVLVTAFLEEKKSFVKCGFLLEWQRSLMLLLLSDTFLSHLTTFFIRSILLFQSDSLAFQGNGLRIPWFSGSIKEIGSRHQTVNFSS